MKTGKFKVGDRVSGLDSEVRGTVMKVLDAGYVMIQDDTFEMEMNLHESELVAGSQPLTPVPPSLKKEDLTIQKNLPVKLDLHLSEQEAASKEHPIQEQLKKLRSGLDLAYRQGAKELEVIHGKGKGKLHQACLQVLNSHSKVRNYEVLKAALESPHGILVHLR